MWAGAYAIETKGAIKVSRLTGKIQIHFATALSGVSTQTIMCLATRANRKLAYFDFERRQQRRDKLELTDGTNVFAEACAAKEGIDSKSHEEIVDNQPG